MYLKDMYFLKFKNFSSKCNTKMIEKCLPNKFAIFPHFAESSENNFMRSDFSQL